MRRKTVTHPGNNHLIATRTGAETTSLDSRVNGNALMQSTTAQYSG